MTSLECRDTLRGDDPLISPHLPGIGIRDHLFEDGILSEIVVLPGSRYFIRDHDDPNLWRELIGDEFEKYRDEYEAELARLEHFPG